MARKEKSPPIVMTDGKREIIRRFEYPTNFGYNRKIVHQVRTTLKYVSSKDRKEIRRRFEENSHRRSQFHI